MNIRSFLFVIPLFLLPYFLGAQQLHTRSKKAEKLYREAVTEYTLGNKIPSELLLIKAIKADKKFIDAYILIATIKEELGYPIGAIDFYKKGLAINPNAIPNMHYYLAKIYLAEGIYAEAKLSFETYLSFNGIRLKLKEDAEFQLQNCIFALEAIKYPVAFKLKNLGPNINTEKAEYFPSLTIDNQFLLFTRRLDKQVKGEQEDFMGAINLNDSLWQQSYPIQELNTPFNEGAASLSADGKTLVFTVCEIFGDYGNNRKGYGSCDLFFARKLGNRWSQPQNLGPPINTSHWESQPSLSSDGKSVYFIRAPKRSQGSSDIYRADLNENGYWKKPVKLNANINTDKDEQSVFIHPDNQTLYFSSDGHIGMGKTDLYMCKWDEETQDWGSAINLGYPINTHKDESSILVAPNGKLGYFASDRKEGYGELDLYSFQLPESVQPEKITYLKGLVYNSKTQELLGAKFELIDIKSGKQIMSSLSDSRDGSFLLTLNLGKDYLLNVSKKNYLFYSDQFLMQKTYKSQNPFLKDIPLQPIAIGEKVILKNIFFETDQSDLQKTSEIELEKLIAFLNNNPKLHIEIRGHTDNIGTTDYNKKLSTERAKAVYDFLLKHQIAVKRLTYHGYGLLEPLEDNTTEEGRAQNRRTEFVVTQL
jgi:outer membrane protein OmpA-like peptidoglycan-associated protein